MYQLSLNLSSANLQIAGAIVGAVLVLGAVLRLILMPRHDRHVLEDYLQRHHPGWRVVRIKWKLRGPGWFGNFSRIYLVAYKGAGEKLRSRYFKVGLFSGVYETMEWPVADLEQTIYKRRATEKRRKNLPKQPA